MRTWNRLARLTLLLVLTAPVSAWGQATPDIPPPPPMPEETSKPTDSIPSDRSQAPSQKSANDNELMSADEATSTQAEQTPAESPEEKKSNPHQRLAPTPNGNTGLLRVGAAYGARARSIRLGLGIDWFSASQMITPNDEITQFGAALSLSGSPVDYLELWLAWKARSTESNQTDPNLLQSLGDMSFGAKGYYPVIPALTLGADMELTFISGIGQNSIDFGSTQFRLRALTSLDFFEIAELPLIAHLNLGFIFDGTDNLVSEPLTVTERFAFGISDFHRFVAGLAVEVPIPYVTPYLEYTIEVPVDYLATPGVVLTASERAGLRSAQIAGATQNEIARPAVQRVIPQRLTPGIRVTAIPRLALDMAVEIGLTPDTATGVQPVPPFNLVFLASYALDPWADEGPKGPPVTVPVLIPEVQEVAPQLAQVRGQVKSKEDGRPVADAIVSFDRGTPVASSVDGRFISAPIEPGPVKVTVRKDGFKGAILEGSAELDSESELVFTLEPDIAKGALRGRITSTDGKPIADAELQLNGPESKTVRGDANGSFSAELAEGAYQVTFSADGFYRSAQRVDVIAKATAEASPRLRPRATQLLADATGDRITLRRGIGFRGRELTDRDKETLDALVDLLLTRSDIKRIRVESHFDQGGKQLTQDRAESIKAYLVEHGVAEGRVDAVGMGSAKPIAPNLTPRGRAQNKRVELYIVP